MTALAPAAHAAGDHAQTQTAATLAHRMRTLGAAFLAIGEGDRLRALAEAARNRDLRRQGAFACDLAAIGAST